MVQSVDGVNVLLKEFVYGYFLTFLVNKSHLIFSIIGGRVVVTFIITLVKILRESKTVI